MTQTTAPILLGRIVGVHGVRGWVKIYSDCRPREALFKHRNFIAIAPNGSTKPLKLLQGKIQGGGLIAQFAEINDRDLALSFNGWKLAIEKLPPAPKGQFYWTDLIGLRVVNREGVELGAVKELFETGANDVIVVEKDGAEFLIPYAIPKYIERVDLAAGVIYVDWHESWNED